MRKGARVCRGEAEEKGASGAAESGWLVRLCKWRQEKGGVVGAVGGVNGGVVLEKGWGKWGRWRVKKEKSDLIGYSMLIKSDFSLRTVKGFSDSQIVNLLDYISK